MIWWSRTSGRWVCSYRSTLNSCLDLGENFTISSSYRRWFTMVCSIGGILKRKLWVLSLYPCLPLWKHQAWGMWGERFKDVMYAVQFVVVGHLLTAYSCSQEIALIFFSASVLTNSRTVLLNCSILSPCSFQTRSLIQNDWIVLDGKHCRNVSSNVCNAFVFEVVVQAFILYCLYSWALSYSENGEKQVK